MPLLNKKNTIICDVSKNRIAYLGALSLLFSYAEMLLPRIIPFFRLGLGNIVILLALDLPLSSFFTLILIKTLAASLMNGTLFSPFFLISISQSVASGLFMYFLNFLISKCNTKKIFRIFGISIYGISLCGSCLSAVVQILLSSFYLGKATYALLGPMMIFSIFSGIITALAADIFKIPQTAPTLIKNASCTIASVDTENEAGTISKFDIHSSKINRKIIAAGIIILCFATVVFLTDNLIVLSIFLIISVVAQILSKRKILIIPHLGIWIFVILTSLFTPSGKVLFSAGFFSITDGALLMGIKKAMKLSTVSCLSQCAAGLKPTGDSLISKTLQYFAGLSNLFRQTEGKLLKKINITLQAEELYITPK